MLNIYSRIVEISAHLSKRQYRLVLSIMSYPCTVGGLRLCRPPHKDSLFPTASGLFTHFEVYHFILDLINKVFDEYVSPYTYGFSSYFRLSYIFIDIPSISTYMYTFLWRAHRSHPTRVAYNPLSPYPTAMVESSFSSWIPNLIFNAPSPMPLYL